MNKIKYILAVIIGVGGLGLQQAKAVRVISGLPLGGVFTSELNQGNSGISGFPAPYGTVNITLSGQTATIIFNTADDYKFGDHGAVAVNINASSFTEAIVTDAHFLSFGSGNEDGFGHFNLTVNNTDGAGDSVTTIAFTVTNTSGTAWTSAADVLAFNSKNFDAAAHMFITSGGIVFTGYAGEGPGTVPDGGTTVMLLGAALGALGMARRFLRRS